MFDVVSNQGPFPPPALPGFIGTMGLSDFRRGPALSLAGCRLRLSDPHRVGSPVLRGSPAPTCRRHYPGGIVRSLSRSVLFWPGLWAPLLTTAAFPVSVPGRLPRYQFRGLLSVTRVTACRLAGPLNGPVHRRLRRCSYLHRRSDCYRLERPLLPGGTDSH